MSPAASANSIGIHGNSTSSTVEESALVLNEGNKPISARKKKMRLRRKFIVSDEIFKYLKRMFDNLFVSRGENQNLVQNLRVINHQVIIVRYHHRQNRMVRVCL